MKRKKFDPYLVGAIICLPIIVIAILYYCYVDMSFAIRFKQLGKTIPEYIELIEAAKKRK